MTDKILKNVAVAGTTWGENPPTIFINIFVCS